VKLCDVGPDVLAQKCEGKGLERWLELGNVSNSDRQICMRCEGIRFQSVLTVSHSSDSVYDL